MFGTLVIALPSSHQGGEVIVTHAGRTETISTSPYSDFDVSWLAWYSDVTHEVKPVTAGRRLVLTYNLVHTTATTKVSARTASSQLQGLNNLLRSWDKNADIVYHTGLAYILGHKYSDASICFENLKGRDQQIVTLLIDASRDGQHLVCLANIERQIIGGCEDTEYGYSYASGGDHHEITDEIERSLKYSKVVDLDGRLVATNLNLGEGDFVQKEPFKDVYPDEEDYEGYTGNEGTTTTHYYRRTVSSLFRGTHIY